MYMLNRLSTWAEKMSLIALGLAIVCLLLTVFIGPTLFLFLESPDTDDIKYSGVVVDGSASADYTFCQDELTKEELDMLEEIRLNGSVEVDDWSEYQTLNVLNNDQPSTKFVLQTENDYHIYQVQRSNTGYGVFIGVSIFGSAMITGLLLKLIGPRFVRMMEEVFDSP